jgi:uncharacterized protein YjbI with pentapeptide repeats
MGPDLPPNGFFVLPCSDVEGLAVMSTKMITDYAGMVTSITAVLAGILAILKYFNYRSRQDELRLVAADFHAVVAALRSDALIERMAGAISLRRFYDATAESGKDTPYRNEALGVTTAILRGQATSDFQKLLADGLGFAGSLYRADLQKTNLQFAYLGAREKGAESPRDVTIDLSYADFYRADLSSASLKGAYAQGAVFYQARLHKTVLSKADLQHASFFEADLKDAKFDNALLYGAKFGGARNIPADLQEKLDASGIYQDKERFRPVQNSSQATTTRVFLSKPGYLGRQCQQHVASLMKILEAEGLQPLTLERSDYPNFGALGELRRLMSGCAGAVILGFPDLLVEKGSWRLNTPEEKLVEGLGVTTPWSQIEGGMAVMLGIPILALRERDVSGGIFELAPGEPGFYPVFVDEDWNTTGFLNAFSNWCSDVREESRTSKAS